MSPPDRAGTAPWRRLWQIALVGAQWLGRVQARVLLTLIYFVVLAPIALIFRQAADPLQLKRRAKRTAQSARATLRDAWPWARAQF